MRWTAGDRGNIQDMRGRSSGMRVGSLGVGGLLVALVLSWVTGVDFLSLLGGGGGGEPATVGTSGQPVETTPQEERMVDFVDAVANDTQNTWQRLLGNRYERTQVVLFRDAINSACGFAQSASGPFYCPSDHKVYLDLGFFRELSDRFGAPGDFAQAYVVAHEFGHHVQNLLGLTARVQQDPRSGASSASVALELQADCFAGLWGHAASQKGRFEAGGVELETGDAEEALRAAASIGDDRLQRMSTGRVVPERFTHGSSAQRVEWFNRGLETGDPQRCDTFGRSTQ
jgi:predicted metalloprotease